VQIEESKIDLKKLEQVKKELDLMGYDYIEGFISNKKDKVKKNTVFFIGD
jgi:hypothetical protein